MHLSLVMMKRSRRSSIRILTSRTRANPGPNRHIKYSTFTEGWRAFDFVFVVVYPTEKESQVMSLLGPYADDQWASQHALSVAQTETQTLADIDRFFAWFNVGHESHRAAPICGCSHCL